MYYNLVGALKRRLLLEWQDSFSRHPVYQKIVPDIQADDGIAQRVQYGIVVGGANASKVQFSADNYIGTIHSHVNLCYVGYPQFPLEWVREDLQVVRKAGRMPTPAGVYYMEILKAPTGPGEAGSFIIDPLLTVGDEPLLLVQSGVENEAQLQNVPAPGTVRLFLNGRNMLIQGYDYTVDETGKIQFLQHFDRGSRISAEYRYPTESIGPLDFYWNTSDATTLPGVVMAFGKRSEKGQKIAVVVTEDRTSTAEAYGGKFEVTFDCEVRARDKTQMEEIADLALMYLLVGKKSVLELEGLEVLDISLSGQSSEPIDEQGLENVFISNLTVQLRADWEMHLPMALTISRVTQTTKEGDTNPKAKNGLQEVTPKMFYDSYPIFVGRNNDYERVT